MKCEKETLKSQKLKEIRKVEVEKKKRERKMLIVEEIRKVYAENYQRSCILVRLLDSLCVSERERGRNKREGNSKYINMKRGEGRLFIN